MKIEMTFHIFCVGLEESYDHNNQLYTLENAERDIRRYLNSQVFLDVLTSFIQPSFTGREKYIDNYQNKYYDKYYDKENECYLVPEYSILKFDFDDPKEVHIDIKNNDIYLKIELSLVENDIKTNKDVMTTDRYEIDDLMKNIINCIQLCANGGGIGAEMVNYHNYYKFHDIPPINIDYMSYRIL